MAISSSDLAGQLHEVFGSHNGDFFLVHQLESHRCAAVLDQSNFIAQFEIFMHRSVHFYWFV